MKAVKTAVTDVCYHGPAPDIGDLWCHRARPGLIMSIWEPDEDEMKLLKEGGKVVLWIYTEPIPPVSLEVHNEPYTEKVAEHPFKNIPELEDKERH